MCETRSPLPEPFPVLADALEEVLQGVDVDTADQVEFAQARWANRVGMAPERMRIHVCRLLDGLARRMAQLPVNLRGAAASLEVPDHERLLLTVAGRAQRSGDWPISLTLLPEQLPPHRQVILAWQAVTAGAGALQATAEQNLQAVVSDPEERHRRSAAGIVDTIIEHMPPERIDILPGTTDEWVCVCGNTPDSSGFYPCLPDGRTVEPVEGVWVEPLYVCAACYRIIDQPTRLVVGVSAPELVEPSEE